VAAAGWLAGYTSAHTRNAYARALGLPPEMRAALPGGPRSPRPAPAWTWIPWCRSRPVGGLVDPAGDLEKGTVTAWAQALHAAHPQAKSTRAQAFAALCAFYRHLRQAGEVTTDPGDLLNRRTAGLSGTDPSATLALSAEQVHALLTAAACDTSSQAVRNQAIVAVLAATGARVAELVALDVGDYYPARPEKPGMLLLAGKGGKKRWQALPAAEVSLLQTYLTVRVPPLEQASTVPVVPGDVAARAAGEDPLFTTRHGHRLHPDTIAPLLRRLAVLPASEDPNPDIAAAGQTLAPVKDRLHPHQLRHAYAVTAEAAGVPISRIQADLGHAHLSTTQTYLHAGQVADGSAAVLVSAAYHTPAGQEPR
jgi:site-specific recombinase XerD